MHRLAGVFCAYPLQDRLGRMLTMRQKEEQAAVSSDRKLEVVRPLCWSASAARGGERWKLWYACVSEERIAEAKSVVFEASCCY